MGSLIWFVVMTQSEEELMGCQLWVLAGGVDGWR